MLGHYLMFNRNCMEALKIYEEALNAEILEIQKYGDMPSNPAFPIADTDKNLILHARLRLDDTEVMCADSAERNTSGDNMYLSITTKDAALVQKAWDVLAPGGRSIYGAYPDILCGAPWIFAGQVRH